MTQEEKYYYSEVFNSIQGEGIFTGQWTLWLRLFMCNLTCGGFGQKFPTKPETYELPYKDFDPSNVKSVTDLPVWEYGCDSSYSWSKKYRHLNDRKTPRELVDLIRETTKTESNPNGDFLHPKSQMTADMCFTGGEPLMQHAQRCVEQMYEHFKNDGNLPRSITFETNGTQPLSGQFETFLTSPGTYNTPTLFSVSPKLWTVAGEKASKAIKPDVVEQYHRVGNHINNHFSRKPVSGQLKFVLGPEKDQWEELDEVLAQFRAKGIDWPVFIMPVGAREEEQRESAGDVAKMAFERGYNVAGRMHVYLFGNAIGT